MHSKSFIKISLLASSVLVTLIACDKASMPRADEITDLTNKAKVQIFNATTSSPGNLVTINGLTVNNTAAVTYGNGYPATAFFLTDPGLSEFSIRPSSGTAQPVLNFPNSLKPGVFYSIFTYDTVNAIRQLTIESAVEIPSDTTSRLRFANFMYSKVGMPNVDIYSNRNKAVIFSNVASTQVTPFIPYASKLLDTLVVRQAGTTTVLFQLNSVSFTPQRVYTAVLRGSYVTPTTTPRTLSVLTNL